MPAATVKPVLDISANNAYSRVHQEKNAQNDFFLSFKFNTLSAKSITTKYFP